MRDVGRLGFLSVLLFAAVLPCGAPVSAQGDPGATPAKQQPADAPPATPPKADTAKPSAASSEELQDLKTALENQEKDILRLVGGTATKTAQVVTCTWTQASKSTISATTGPFRLECNAALAVSGNYIAAIDIEGLPATTTISKNFVQAVAADVTSFLRETAVSAESCPDAAEPTFKNLSCDYLEVGDGALVSVHRDRWFGPSYGGFLSNAKDASFALRHQHRKNLSLVVSSNVKAIRVTVTAGRETRSAVIPVVYQLWTFETGGFYGFSNLTDQVLVMHTGSNTTLPVHVDAVRNSGQSSQESGIFVSMSPRNYPFLGIGFGVATSTDRSQSFFLGPSIRLLTFGDHGLASFSVAVADRQVRVFKGVVGQDFATDSTSLKGNLESRVGYAILINLGFKFGSTSSDTTGPAASAAATTQ